METDIVYRNENGIAVTTSYLVAETFGKEHKIVCRDIDNLLEKLQSVENQCSTDLYYVSPVFDEYFEDISLPCGGTKKAKRYFMNEEGFTLLVMGYTGQKAMKFKLKYMAAFKAMKQQLEQESSQGITQSLENLTRKQILQMALEAEEEKERFAARLVLAENRNAELQASVESILPRIEQLEKRMSHPVQPSLPKVPVVKEFHPEEVKGLTDYQRAHLFDKKKMRAIHPLYITTMEAIKRMKKKGIYIGKVELFEYLRTSGYLSSHPYTYNCPEEHCIKNGWMLITQGGYHNDRPKSKHPYTPYLSPKFVTLLEQILRERMKSISESVQLSLPMGKEVEG